MTNIDPCEVIPRFNDEYQDQHKSAIFVKPFELSLPDGTTLTDGTRETVFLCMRFRANTATSDEGMNKTSNGSISKVSHSQTEFEGVTLWDKDYTDGHDNRIVVFDYQRHGEIH